MRVRSRRGSTVLSRFPAIVLLMLAVGLAGCGGSGPYEALGGGDPRAETDADGVHDSAPGFSTTDLRDVQEQIVQLNSVGELIWTADGTRIRGVPGHPPVREREGDVHRRQDLPRRVCR